jgi:hypothetical protein
MPTKQVIPRVSAMKVTDAVGYYGAIFAMMQHIDQMKFYDKPALKAMKELVNHLQSAIVLLGQLQPVMEAIENHHSGEWPDERLSVAINNWQRE